MYDSILNSHVLKLTMQILQVKILLGEKLNGPIKIEAHAGSKNALKEFKRAGGDIKIIEFSRDKSSKILDKSNKKTVSNNNTNNLKKKPDDKSSKKKDNKSNITVEKVETKNVKTTSSTRDKKKDSKKPK